MKYWISKHGDHGLAIEFEATVSIAMSQRVQTYYRRLQKAALPAVIAIIPAFCSLTIEYAPELTTFEELSLLLSSLLDTLNPDSLERISQRVLVVPVCYQEPYNLDLNSLSEQCHLSPEEVIAKHTRPDYYIHALGFLPGFPYLGGLDQQLRTPRLSQPRLKTPKGSVGIAGEQTGIYPLDSPGGWNIIGRTPLILFDPSRDDPIPFHAGDWIRFEAISFHEFQVISQAIAIGEYEYQWFKETTP